MEAFMANRITSTGIKLSGNWNLSGVVVQIEALSTLHHLESGLEKLFMEKLINVDCSDISSVDLSGLQLLHVWMQCISLRGAKPELINLTEDMQQTIRRFGLEKWFA